MRGAFALASLALVLAGCGGPDMPPAEPYTALHYEYLPRLKLNVGDIAVEDHSAQAGPDDVAGRSPVVPAQAVAQMAHDRIFAAGGSGTATFVIDQASILRGPDGVLNGTLAVHMDITTPSGAAGGHMAAQVVRQHIPGTDPENDQNNLYDLTKQMLAAMNVEFEFQLRRTLATWLSSGAPVPAPVQAQPLDTAPLPPPSQEAPQQMSPPPGYLVPPPGAVPAPSY